MAVLEDTNYYAFGLTIAGISAKAPGKLENRSKYNGYELNSNFDLNVYESFYRTHDPQLGRWWQIDPKPNNSESPYVAMGDNPISQMDPLGDTLKISFKTGFLGLGKTKQVTYNDGKLTNNDGSIYTGKVKGFLKNAVGAIGQTASGPVGASMVDEVQNSTSTVTVVKSNSGNSYDPGTNTIGFDPSSKSGGLNTTGTMERPSFIGFAHELAHSLDDIRGTLNTSRIPGQNFAYAEQFATYKENQIRAEHFLPLRQYYGFDPQTAGGIYPLINNGGRSLFYGNYDYYNGVRAPAVRAAPLPTVVVPPLNKIPTINIKIK